MITFTLNCRQVNVASQVAGNKWGHRGFINTMSGGKFNRTLLMGDSPSIVYNK